MILRQIVLLILFVNILFLSVGFLPLAFAQSANQTIDLTPKIPDISNLNSAVWAMAFDSKNNGVYFEGGSKGARLGYYDKASDSITDLTGTGVIPTSNIDRYSSLVYDSIHDGAYISGGNTI